MYQVYQRPLKGKSVGVVFGSFAPMHQGHLDIILRAKKENDGGCLVIVCGYEGDKGEEVDLPLKRRYRYVRELFVDDDLVAVGAIDDSELNIARYPNGWEDWMKEFNNIYKLFVKNPSQTEKVWYVGDKEYEDGLKIINEKAVLVNRMENPICATYIRENPLKYWNKITQPFKRAFSINILVTGTASEGKTTLVQDLGKYFNAPYSCEWARDYMRENSVYDNELDGIDYLAFLYGQYQLNKSKINSDSNKGIFFADTDSLVTKMYAEYYAKDSTFNLTEEEYIHIARASEVYDEKSKWDKIFLLAPKNQFFDDHERYMAHSNKEIRQELFDILCRSIKESGNWNKVVILTGNYNENFDTIKNYVKEIIDGANC